MEGPAPMTATITTIRERLMTSIRLVRTERRADTTTKAAATRTMMTRSAG